MPRWFFGVTMMEDTEQSFYIAVIVYKSTSDAPDYKPLYEECFTFIKAASEEEAKTKALEYARSEKHSYKNLYGATISWDVEDVIDVNGVLCDSFEDCTDLYARHFRNYQAYESFAFEEL